MFQSEKSLVDSSSVEMWVVDHAVRRVVRGHLLLEDQLRDGERVKGRACGRVVGSLSGHAVVLNRGQMLEHHRWDLGSEVVLHLPFQLHPPVLEPGPHLRERKKNNKVRIQNKAESGLSVHVMERGLFALGLVLPEFLTGSACAPSSLSLRRPGICAC